jgi:DNA-binding NarL/FixJ family response regulator
LILMRSCEAMWRTGIIDFLCAFDESSRFPRRVLHRDDLVVRKGVRDILESQPGYTVSGEAEDGADAVRQVFDSNPDVLILDITMPVMNGIEAAREILQKRPALPIVILSMHDSGSLEESAKKIGVRGYVPKTRTAEELVKAVEAVTSGRTYFRSSR